ncbi:DUF4192 domain-containing protein [Corynebacterium striatum]|uniref:DUF4192 domain-containing protein n=1 Tax=Corynebacterium striatum TaxID=43770 RepID=UPI001A33C1A6|nr:DUF4192 domain-containing protein [Corynebacterium striatum]MDK8789069.1 DUF4192 domain-containing protein [Corynebacterium striatum]HAT1212503.1 DUF4192 domain-containing protein [Corynebacterium striatum]HAT1474879.1 DUF4192 domain-containing protein [Corynebacterium striatum]HAT6524632.1 DUF4192 domain-containing protein [Corynebacterium striatum]HAT6562764.1 DUF4192 domain-containing protein [Corynebacterium striatum]
MTNYLNQRKSSAPINTPGHLLANVPGALGFYPTDSVIFMTFEPCPQGMAMGPVARIDFDDAQEALPEIWETIVSPQTEGVFAFFITERPMDEVEALAEWMYALHKHTHGMDIDAAWHTTEIVTGARYEILFGVVNHEGNGPMKKWREGPIPALTDAPTMQHCVGKELIPELSREELYQKFACDNSRLSREESKRIAKRALAHARQFRAEVELSDDDPDSAIEDFLGDAWWQLRCLDDLDATLGDVEALETCATWMATTWSRDLVIAQLCQQPDKASVLLLATARTFEGVIRYNALALYAITQMQLDRGQLAGPALNVLTEEAPEHSLGGLVHQIFRLGLSEKLVDVLRTASDVARQMVGQARHEAEGAGEVA